MGANYDDVRYGMGTDSRIGKKFLYAGIGYGGSCFPKDVRALIKTAKDVGSPIRIIEMVEEVNEKQKVKLLAKIESHFKGESLKGKTFAVWGLAFKPDTDDMREAPSIPIISELYRLGVNLQVYDPEAEETSKYYFDGKVKYASGAYDALDGAEALLLLTEWREFREPDILRVPDI